MYMYITPGNLHLRPVGMQQRLVTCIVRIQVSFAEVVGDFTKVLCETHATSSLKHTGTRMITIM